MATDSRRTRRPDPKTDWTSRRKLAVLLGISEQTAAVWDREGKLRRFEHGLSDCGRRKYSRALLERELQRNWDQAVRALDAKLKGD